MENRPRQLYLCNPVKNKQCLKRNCMFTMGLGNCYSTDKVDCAELNIKGEPIKTFYHNGGGKPPTFNGGDSDGT